MSEEAEPFLADTDSGGHQKPNNEASSTTMSKALIAKIAAHLLLMSLYTIASIIFIKFRTSNCWSFPRNAIDHLQLSYSHGSYDLYESSKFVGSPDPATDAKWHHLLRTKSIRVSKEELLRNERQSVELPGGGYLAWLGFFHELHCVNLLREWKYKEHYFANASQEERNNIEKHTDHCLDRIRATLMCHPDVSSLTTFFWDVEPQPKVNGTKTLHECVDWSAMMASIEQRTVSHKEISALQNPRLSNTMKH